MEKHLGNLSLNTKNLYKLRQAHWEVWCAKQEFEDGNTVSEAKLVAFLREVSRTGNIKNKRSKLPDGKAKRLGKESLAGYAKAVGALQTVQAAVLGNKNPPARGTLVKNLLSDYDRENAIRRRIEYEDRGTNTINDGYTLDELRLISRYQFNRNTPYHLRNRLDFLLGHAILGRGKTKRMMQLPDLFSTELADEGPSKWHMENESFPEFTARQDWYDIHVLKGLDRTKPITYNTQRDGYMEALNAVGVNSSKITHINRGSALRAIADQDVPDNEQWRIGRWGSDRMVGCYLTSLPKQAMRALAGFYSQKAGAFWLPRSAVDPPQELQRLIFPKIEYWENMFERGAIQKDLAGPNFLVLLKYLRIVFLQDSVVLKQQHPTHFLWSHAIFDNPLYKQYEIDLSSQLIERVLPHLTNILRASLGNISGDIDGIKNTINNLNVSQQAGFANVTEAVNGIFSNPLYLSRTPTNFHKQGMITTAGEVAQDSSDHTFADDSPSLPSSSVPSSSISSSLSSSSPPQYTLNRKFCTVTDVWREYDHGVAGNPSVRSLEDKYKTKWRKNSTESRFFSRRKIIYEEVKRIANDRHISFSDAAQVLEDTRRDLKISIDKLTKKISEQHKEQQ
ncbi:hypothetical protein INT45_009470 [Circinella minor]|uniref:Transcription activator GCR1-like domain-containing protein n=1 Tax=Circinella minor TaxID=1195481 RepID=A0A8H7RQL7_9FUNG|nr:hypothetical protein INT45_009470 [Circinella minor]